MSRHSFSFRSSILRLMFLPPCVSHRFRASFGAAALTPLVLTPPHRICFSVSIALCSHRQFGLHFLHCHPPKRLRRFTGNLSPLLVAMFGKPIRAKLLHDHGRLLAVSFHGGLELTHLVHGGIPLPLPDLGSKSLAEKEPKRLVRQLRHKVAGQVAKLLFLP